MPSLPNPPLAMAPPQPVAPQAMTLPPPASLQPGLAAGRDDRLVWNAWFSGLRGAYRDGAATALNQLGLPQRGACYGANGVNRGDFTLGCEIAQQRLAAVAVRLRGNANYAAGWNGSGMVRPVGAVGPTEAAYQGAYFCGHQMARLTTDPVPAIGQPAPPRGFQLRAIADEPGRAARRVHRGGIIRPAWRRVVAGAGEWVTQPAGYSWLGLTGRSDDGGRTFSGRVIDSTNLCTTFTLARIADASARR